ncbi:MULTISPECIES: hypothetical protein [unclassified Bradyrhizobium]|uniref:hypothetical protein n=1 Tax=unclassified Bradyrhizobium TaxID=2631580 RepID=UPI00040A6806|nr:MULTISPECIES: hypothetical protein [unclassified Bradyrhizobium]
MNEMVSTRNITDQAQAVQTQSATHTWYLNAYQLHGNLWLSWQTTAPFRAQQGQIMVYSSQFFPSNPQDNVKTWQWDNISSNGWDTGLPWGSGWYCAWNAQRSPNGPYTYVVQLVTK